MDWIKWKTLPDRKKWEALEKLDRLSYDHASDWIVGAIMQIENYYCDVLEECGKNHREEKAKHEKEMQELKKEYCKLLIIVPCESYDELWRECEKLWDISGVTIPQVTRAIIDKTAKQILKECYDFVNSLNINPAVLGEFDCFMQQQEKKYGVKK